MKTFTKGGDFAFKSFQTELEFFRFIHGNTKLHEGFVHMYDLIETSMEYGIVMERYPNTMLDLVARQCHSLYARLDMWIQTGVRVCFLYDSTMLILL